MIAALLSLILARPFGSQSLVQRLMSSMLGSQATRYRKEAKVAETRIIKEAGVEQGRQWCNAINEYVFKTSVDGREEIRARAVESGKHLVSVIAGNSTIPPAVEAHLNKLLSLLSVSRDYDSIVEFSSSAEFVKVIKDSLSVVLYGPLTKWSKVCKLNDRVYDLQVFLDDLVNTARSKENGRWLSCLLPKFMRSNILFLSDFKGIAAFVSLTERHQQSLYFLFHVSCHSKSK